jgi:uncharacterized protein YjbI with pentapeptide repeats
MLEANRQYRVTILVVAIILVVVSALIIVEIRLYGTGFEGKTLWDWLQLLIIPAVLAVAGYVINLTISRGEQAATEQRAQSEREAAEKRAETEREIALDNQREAALQAYINEISDLLLHEDLRDSKPEDKVRKIARVRTLTVLSRLDKVRKWNVLQFLCEADLIYKYRSIYKSGILDEEQPIVDLMGADFSEISPKFASLLSIRLSGANLSHAYLSRADLKGAECISTDLSHAYLFGASLEGADLSDSHLDGANLLGARMKGTELHGAHLMDTDLSQSDLSGADLNDANLSRANLTGALQSHLVEKGEGNHVMARYDITCQEERGILLSTPPWFSSCAMKSTTFGMTNDLTLC